MKGGMTVSGDRFRSLFYIQDPGARELSHQPLGTDTPVPAGTAPVRIRTVHYEYKTYRERVIVD